MIAGLDGLPPLLFRLAALVLLPLFSACATGYHKAGIFGDGYSEEKLAPERWLVTFAAGTFTPRERIQEYLLRRGAEIAVDNDARYFAVLSGSPGDFHPAGTRANLIENPSWMSSVVADATAAQSAPRKGFWQIVIQTYKDRRPDRLANVYEAREVLEKFTRRKQGAPPSP